MPRPYHQARRITIRGIVQGVGFRPFVFHEATDLGLCGWVINGEAGVEIHAEGSDASLDTLIATLRCRSPAAAEVAEVTVRRVDPSGCADFQIRESRRDATPTVMISPDLPLCNACRREMFDPNDRRYHYPYINCTDCGPRYSIVRELPYDRPNTTMADWPMCEACRAEYSDPGNRRYHAQPIACPACGPDYRLLHAGHPSVVGEAAIGRAAELLRQGRIVAVKGIGGYHLACDARNRAAIGALRERKFRKEKPFAVMVASADDARNLAELTDAHLRLLADVARPIVLAMAKIDLAGVVSDTSEVGIMLPYAPLHDLLFDHGAPNPLVLTSANRSSEPIAYRDDDARERLQGIADAFLIGERPIARRVDDSVIAVRDGRPRMIRRSRGYAPRAVASLPGTRPILALGADLKNSVALVVEGQVFVSQFIGDLGDLEVDRAFSETVHDLMEMYGVRQQELIVAHDLHPQFTSTRYAENLRPYRRVGVQHHHAHIASVLAEHGACEETVLGIALDGTGYGTDGTIWGFELLVGNLRDGLERSASLRPFRLPGGDAAARFPVQAAAGLLHEVDELPDMMAPPFRFPQRFGQAMQLVARDVRCFASTSAGRLFAAVAALLGFTREVSFEGQAAIWLESLARASDAQCPYPFPGFDTRPLLGAIVADRLAGRPVGEIAYAFHAALVARLVDHVRQSVRSSKTLTVALSGGVFQNALLLELLFASLADDTAVRLLTNRQVPVNDGGICLGQAAIARCRVDR
ncbi:MAG: carbamoyltransferase HypF [Pirellulales bacterium]